VPIGIQRRHIIFRSYYLILIYQEVKNEKNLSAEKKTEKKGTRIQKKNEHSQRKKNSQEEKSQRQKASFSLGSELLYHAEKRSAELKQKLQQSL
jgi:hypothetical protein